MEVARLVTSFESKGVGAVLGDTRKVEGALDGISGHANRVGGAFSGMGKAIAVGLGVVAAAGVANVAKSFLMLNANAEQARNSLETVTGSAARANELFGKLQKFAAATPFEFPELVQASINLEAFGLKTEDWIGTIGDTASAMGKSVDQVTQAVMDASTGEYERLKELGIKARVEGDKLVLGYRDRTATIDKNNKAVVLSTIKSFWNQGYAGAMKKQSRTFLGQWSTLKDNFKMTVMDMTKGFFDFTKGVLTEGNQFFGLFQSKMKAGLDPVHAALSALHVTLDQVFGKEAGDTIDATLRGIVDGLGAIGGAVVELGGDLIRGDVGKFFSDLGDDVRRLAEAGIDLGTIAVKAVFELAKDIPRDVWNWFLDKIGLGGPAASTEGTMAGGGNVPGGSRAPVDLGDVFVTAALKLAGELERWAGDLWGWVKAQLGIGGGPGTAAGGTLAGGGNMPGGTPELDLGSVTVDIGAFFIGPDVFGRFETAVQDALTTDPVHLSPKIELDIEASSFRLTRAIASLDLGDVLSGVRWFFDPKKMIAAAVVLNPAAAMSALALKIFGPAALEAFAATVRGVFAGIFGPGGPLAGITIPVPSWNLSLPTPNLSFGGAVGGFAGAFHGGFDLAKAIAEKVAGVVPSVPLPSWHLTLPTPDIPTLGDAFTVADWIGQKIDTLGDITTSVLEGSFHITLPIPDFPNFTSDLDFLNWFEPVLDSFDYTAELLEGLLHITLPVPDFPNLDVGFIASAITDALTAIGDLVLSFPGSVSVNIGSIIPHGSFTIPFTGTVVTFAKGGFVDSPFALVGERGPELVSLPRGSYVHTASATRGMLRHRPDRGGVVNNYFVLDNAIVGKGGIEDIRRMAREEAFQIVSRAGLSARLAGRS